MGKLKRLELMDAFIGRGFCAANVSEIGIVSHGIQEKLTVSDKRPSAILADSNVRGITICKHILADSLFNVIGNRRTSRLVICLGKRLSIIPKA
jgi:hypothetical protein